MKYIVDIYRDNIDIVDIYIDNIYIYNIDLGFFRHSCRFIELLCIYL